MAELVLLTLGPAIARWGAEKAKQAFTPENMAKMKEFVASEGKMFSKYEEKQISDKCVVDVAGLAGRIREYQNKMKRATRDYADFQKGVAAGSTLQDVFDIDPDAAASDIAREITVCYFSYYDSKGTAGEGKLAWMRLPDDPTKACAMINVTTVDFELSQWAAARKWRWLTGGKQSLPTETKDMITKRTQMSMLMNMKADGFLADDPNIPPGQGEANLRRAIGLATGEECEDPEPLEVD